MVQPKNWVKKNGIIVATAAGRWPRKAIPDASAIKSGRISKQWPTLVRSISNTASKGLDNPRNTCYRNAMLQCLIHQPTIFNFLGNTHQNCESVAGQCVTCAFQALVQSYWNDPYQPPVPALPTEAVSTLHAAIRYCVPVTHTFYDSRSTNIQGDSHEFLEYLLGEVQAKQRVVGSHFDRMFMVRHQSSWFCEDCETQHVKPHGPDGTAAGGLGMTVGIEHPQSDLPLTDYIRALHDDTVDIRCDNDKCAANGSKKRERNLIINRAPEVLFIKIERTSYVMGKKTVTQRKLRQNVAYDEILDLTRWSDESIRDARDELRYQLDGVVVHVGNSLRAGHYFAAVREHSGTTFRSVNDRAVGQYQGGGVQELLQPRGKAKGDLYILVYSKIRA